MINKIETVSFDDVKARRDREVEFVQRSIEHYTKRIEVEGPDEDYETILVKQQQKLEDLNDETIWIPRFTTSIVLELVDEYLSRKAKEIPALQIATDIIRAEWYHTCVDGTIECIGEENIANTIFERDQPKGILDCVSNLDHARSFLKAYKEKAKA